ncbi:MAG: outer membrane lipoprotein-sorting protein [Cytophagales bacterium]|nr:outer membrane lipoprotein-sorting protein [Cytophagales bacterium]
MKHFKTLLIVAGLMTAIISQSQTVDEIIDGYFENTGGLDNWKSLTGIKMTAKVNQGGMEIPLEIVYMADGRTYTKITIQGAVIMQGVFDGETMWSTNFASMKAEKSDAETTANYMLDINDFPDSFMDYKEKGYTAELLGQETIDGTETFKIQLTKEPRTIDGESVEDVTYYYFDTEAFIPIAQDSEVKQGPQKGAIGRITQSDYLEVDGLYFPFSQTQGIKDGPSQPLIIDSIELNPQIEDSAFAYPEE